MAGRSASERPLSTEQLLTETVWLASLARGLLHDEHEAEDVAQEVRLAALSRAPADPSRARSWFASVARNLALRARLRKSRRDRREQLTAAPESLPSTLELVERVHAQRRVVDAVLALAEPYRSVVLLRYFDALTARDIAARQGVPIETVRTRLKRAHAQLREQLDRDFGSRQGWAGPMAATGLAAVAGVTMMSVTTKFATVAAIVLAGVALWQIALRFGTGERNADPAHAAAAPARAEAAESSGEVPDAARVEETRAPAELLPSGALVVRVSDEEGRPLRAQLFTGARDDVRPVGETGDEGMARLAVADSCSWITVRAAGMQIAERALPKPRPAELAFKLVPGAMIAGVVTMADGNPVGAGVRVVAINAGRARGRNWIVALCEGRAIGPKTETDASGAFSIDGLTPDESCFLAAGGQGFVNLPDQPSLPAGTDHAIVQVGGLYAVDLEVTQRGGTPLPFADWFGPPIYWADRDKEHAKEVIADAALAAVAGVPVDRMLPTRSRRLFLHVRADPSEERLGPLAHRVQEAGFVPVSVELWLPRFTGEIATQRVELEPERDVRRGRITVEVLGEERVLDGDASEGHFGSLTFNATDGRDTGPGWNAGIRFGSGRKVVITGVPFGDYTWSFQPDHGHYQTPLFEVDKQLASVRVEGDDAHVTLDLRDCGDAEFEVVRPDGSPFESSLTLELVDPRPKGGTGYSSFEQPPFVVAALRAGRYRAIVHQAGWWSAKADPDPAGVSAELEVTAGALTRCRLTLPK